MNCSDNGKDEMPFMLPYVKIREKRMLDMPIFRSSIFRFIVACCKIIKDDILDLLQRKPDASIFDMLYLWPKGFSINKRNIYDFNNYSFDDYASDFEISYYLDNVNRGSSRIGEFFDNKLLFNFLAATGFLMGSPNILCLRSSEA